MLTSMIRRSFLATLTVTVLWSSARADDKLATLLRTARSGVWSDKATWEVGKVPAAGARVQIKEGHTVTYDVKSDQPIRSIHVAGTLTFARDTDTQLNIGLIKIQPGDDASENGFDCDAHMSGDPAGVSPLSKPALEVGSPDKPIPSKHTALIRLVTIEGLDKETCPAIVCCGGRMDFHGAGMHRTWVKLGATAKKGETEIKLAEHITGWKVGDRLIITATKNGPNEGGTRKPKGRNRPVHTEERIIKAISPPADVAIPPGPRVNITLDQALEEDHLGEGEFRGEVANLSRNVVVESADLANRGHTMYHKNSAGAISYAEFRHLGKENVLGKYAIHYHLVGNTMRGSTVIGASIWDSGNRWVTIHGTNYLVVRDCVGYQSTGHGFFLEDGTEIYNILDRNLAVQAYRGKPLPKQVLPFDANEGAGFWWSNCHNTFTRNVSCENDRYGYRFEATSSSYLKLNFPILQPDGSKKVVDIRTLPFVRFEDNESHCEGLYGVNLGEGVDRVGPDEHHPFIVRNLKVWDVNYAFRPQVPCLLAENLHFHKANYGVYHPNFDRHVYRNLRINGNGSEPFNRGHDDISVQYGVVTVDGLTFKDIYGSRDGVPLIQISDDNPTGKAESHFKNVKVVNRGESKRALVNLGGGPRPDPKTEKGVPIYIHDYFAPGRHAKVVSTRAKDLINDGSPYREELHLTGDESRATEVRDVKFPALLDPVDDLPPATVITRVTMQPNGRLAVWGCTSDNGTVKKVLVNGKEAEAWTPNFLEWKVELEVEKGEVKKITAHAEDAAGNVEKTGHEVSSKQ